MYIMERRDEELYMIAGKVVSIGTNLLKLETLVV